MLLEPNFFLFKNPCSTENPKSNNAFITEPVGLPAEWILGSNKDLELQTIKYRSLANVADRILFCEPSAAPDIGYQPLKVPLGLRYVAGQRLWDLGCKPASSSRCFCRSKPNCFYSNIKAVAIEIIECRRYVIEFFKGYFTKVEYVKFQQSYLHLKVR